MNKRIKICILFLALGLLISPLYGQQIFETRESQLFDSPTTFSTNNPLNKAPGPGILPPTEENKVGAPIEDIYWLIALLAVIYGIFKRKNRN